MILSGLDGGMDRIEELMQMYRWGVQEVLEGECARFVVQANIRKAGSFYA